MVAILLGALIPVDGVCTLWARSLSKPQIQVFLWKSVVCNSVPYVPITSVPPFETCLTGMNMGGSSSIVLLG